MSSLVIFWISVGIGFLIIEMITVTFYGLAISLAGFVTAIYVWYMGYIELNAFQWLIFAIMSFCASYFLPKWLSPKWQEKAQWLDTYIGEVRKVKLVGEDFKVTFDGIDYIVDIDGVTAGKKVTITGRKGSLFYGTIVK
jgi:membrane protein implicated in regulation of membrane protease activity